MVLLPTQVHNYASKFQALADSFSNCKASLPHEAAFNSLDPGNAETVEQRLFVQRSLLNLLYFSGIMFLHRPKISGSPSPTQPAVVHNPITHTC